MWTDEQEYFSNAVVVAVCKHCNEEIIRGQEHVHYNPNTGDWFCSDTCMTYEYNLYDVLDGYAADCEHCGATVTEGIIQIEHDETVYCDLECYCAAHDIDYDIEAWEV